MVLTALFLPQAAGSEAASAMLVLSGVLVGAGQQLADAASTVRAVGGLGERSASLSLSLFSVWPV